MSWRTGEYADPILPEGKVIATILTAKQQETAGGTPMVSVMARVNEFLDDFDASDPTILNPAGQTVFGTIWLPKEGEEAKKTQGKNRRTRAFLEALMADGAEYVSEDEDSPVDVLLKNLQVLIGKKFKTDIELRVDESGTYPTKAELSFFQPRRA